MVPSMVFSGRASIEAGVRVIAKRRSLAASVVLSCVRRLRMHEIKTVNGVSTYFASAGTGQRRISRLSMRTTVWMSSECISDSLLFVAAGRNQLRSGGSIVTRFRSAKMYARWCAHHGVTPSKDSGSVFFDGEVVTERAKFLERRFGNQWFDTDIATFERRLREPAGFKRLLNRQAEVCDVCDELGVRLGLIEPAHNAEAYPVTILLHEARNDCVQGALTRGQRVGVIGLQGEERAAIVQGKTRTLRYERCAEAHVDTLDQRRNVAFAVDCAEIDSVVSRRVCEPVQMRRFDEGSGLLHIDLPGLPDSMIRG